MRPLVAISAGLAALAQAQSPALACGPMATLSFVGQEMVLQGHFGPDGSAIVSGLTCS